jgi:hypothetical protein
MSESNGRCEFEHLDYCCPPEWVVKSGYHCSKALPMEEGDIAEKCGAIDADLMTEEEWEAEQSIDKMKGSIDMWEMKGYRRK